MLHTIDVATRLVHSLTVDVAIVSEGQYLEVPAATPEDAPPPAEGEEVKKLPMRHGIGVYKKDGNEYEGQWTKDEMQGHGK